MCGCSKSKNAISSRSNIGFRSTPVATNPAVVRTAALAAQAMAANQSVDNTLNADRREIERKRREAILKRLGKL